VSFTIGFYFEGVWSNGRFTGRVPSEERAPVGGKGMPESGPIVRVQSWALITGAAGAGRLGYSCLLRHVVAATKAGSNSEPGEGSSLTIILRRYDERSW